ncbi:MAG TPA: hypothetical protein VKD22_09510 [Ramlibacter sp.]|nr:hypothetical protein [Ramlibacter sp.]
MSTHTPGPWTADEFDEDQTCVWSAGGILVCHACTVDAEGEANARLVAAAPDLLEACRLALPHHQGGHSKVGAALRAAIAKAVQP